MEWRFLGEGEGLAGCGPLLRRIDEMLGRYPQVLLAIDGDAAAGKSTLGAGLQSLYDSNLFHMDHFFLQAHQRTEARAMEPGGNVDYERFHREVLLPVLGQTPFSYRPFSCQTGTFGEAIAVEPRSLVIVEGAYSLHPTLAAAYHIKVFLAVEGEEQMRRIRARNGENMAMRFLQEWIPKEKEYFLHFDIQNHCHFLGKYGILEETTEFTEKRS